MPELGNTLSRARRARAITLEDAERDTHVSKRYLQALEAEDFAAFPAPVYARGFLRTYSRYLGLNPDELIRVFPNGDLTLDLAPLPTVRRPTTQISVNWVVAGAVALFLLGAAFLLWSSGSDTATVGDAARRPASAANPAVIVPPAAATPAVGGVQGKPIVPRPGAIPDFVDADINSVLAFLRDNQMSYIIIELTSRTKTKDLVISQTPAAGAKAEPGQPVTLYVSKGP